MAPERKFFIQLTDLSKPYKDEFSPVFKPNYPTGEEEGELWGVFATSTTTVSTTAGTLSS